MPGRFQNPTTTTVPVDFKCARRKMEAQRQFGTGEKLFDHNIAFRGSILRIVAAAAARIRTARTANPTAMFKRPPKSARLAEHVSENLRVTESHVGSRKPAGAIASDNDLG